MKYFVCPQGDQCGPKHIIAKEYSQTYSIDTSALRDDENFCSHVLSFDINGGTNDILKVKFLQSMPDTKISFSIGHTYKTAKGEIIRDNINEQILKVAFPNSIYMQIEHPRGESVKTGRFSFEFWYRN